MPIHDYKTSVIICAKGKGKLSLPAGKSLAANRRQPRHFFILKKYIRRYIIETSFFKAKR